MSGGSRDYYYSSNTAKSSRSATKREDDRGGREQDLPRIRDLTYGHAEQFDESRDPTYDLRGMGRALTQQSSHNAQPSLRLPPIRESSSRTRQEDYGHRGSSEIAPPHHRDRSYTSSRTQSSSRAQPTNQPAYHVLAPSSAGGSLVPVSSSHTKPPGIVRGHVLPMGLQSGDDARKKFECPVCGRRMERQSVYNQHMLTHTDERPHVCSYCPKSFNSKSNLNRHTLTHTGSIRPADDDEPSNHHDRGSSSSSKNYYTSSRRA
ncbi:hypothetical protein JB92DRAFT_3104766 [Gautieria morchelliformis]|nr:hypothetical protein JB92DRAFT_3104766 [Gautieria morchelliformis]